MTEYAVTVIMPAFRHERVVRAAAESVLGQTHHKLELIAIDDASPDATAQVLDAVASRDNRVQVVRNDSNRGLIHNLNLGLSRAQGEIIAVIASDDVWLPHKLQAQCRALVDAEWTYGRAAVMTEDGVVLDQAAWGEKLGSRRLSPFEDLLLANRIPALTLAAHRSALLDLGGWSAGALYEDYDLNLRLAVRGPAAFVDQVLALYRQMPGSLSSTLTASGRDVEALESCFTNLLRTLDAHDARRQVVSSWMRVRLAVEAFQAGDTKRAMAVQPEDARRLRQALRALSNPDHSPLWKEWLAELRTVSPSLSAAALKSVRATRVLRR